MQLPNEKFRFDEETSADGKTVIKLKGIIDEDTHLEPLLKSSGSLEINFKDISSINSCGVRSWVNFLKQSANIPITYAECPPLIVRQMNMIPSFVGHAKVQSVYVPYICEECEQEKLSLVTADKFSTVGSEEEEQCSSCKQSVMEFDGNAKQYFAFNKK